MVSGERFLVKDREALSIVSTEGRNRRLFAPYANFITVEGDSIFTRLLDVPLVAQIVGRIDLSHNGH